MAGSVLCRGYVVALMGMMRDDNCDDGMNNEGRRAEEAKAGEEEGWDEEEVTELAYLYWKETSNFHNG